MISHEHKCIYIHIPKTAGTSIEKHFGFHESMDARLKQDHRTVRNIMAAISPFSGEGGSIKNVLRYINQRYHGMRLGVGFVNRSQFNTYFKFCFVRNPWDRAYSWYRNVKRDPRHQRKLGIDENVTFHDFLTVHSEQWALMSQIDWIIDTNGNIAVDYIGKFENLEDDFCSICERLGIEDSNLPVTLHSGNASYLDAYDDKLRKLVGDRYSKEIELFNYKFGE